MQSSSTINNFGKSLRKRLSFLIIGFSVISCNEKHFAIVDNLLSIEKKTTVDIDTLQYNVTTVLAQEDFGTIQYFDRVDSSYQKYAESIKKNNDPPIKNKPSRRARDRLSEEILIQRAFNEARRKLEKINQDTINKIR